MSEKIILGSNGIKRVLRKFSPVEAIAEYIWNGYDADATKIDVQIDANAIEGINKITGQSKVLKKDNIPSRCVLWLSCSIQNQHTGRNVILP